MSVKAYLKYFSRAGCGPCAQFTGDGRTSVWGQLDSDADLRRSGIKTEKIFFDQTGKEAPTLSDLDPRYVKFVRSVPCLYLHAPGDLERGMLYNGDRSNAQTIKMWINNNVSAVISASNIGNTVSNVTNKHSKNIEHMNGTQRITTTAQRRTHQPSSADLAKYEQVIREHQGKLGQLNQVSKTDMSHTVRSAAATMGTSTKAPSREIIPEPITMDRAHNLQRPIVSAAVGVTDSPSVVTLDKYKRPTIDRPKQKREFVTSTTAGLGNMHQTHNIGVDTYSNDRSVYAGSTQQSISRDNISTDGCGCTFCPKHVAQYQHPIVQSASQYGNSDIVTRPIRVFGRH